MTPADWAGLIVSITTIIASIAYSIKWLTKHYLAELKPNGGSSLKDSVKRLEQKIMEADEQRCRMDQKLDKMYDTLLEHIAANNK
jgi:hypothetical protein